MNIESNHGIDRSSRTNSDTTAVVVQAAPDKHEIDAQRPATIVSTQDGGAFAWVQCAGAFCLFFNSWGLVNSFGAFQAYYKQDVLKNSSPSQISWIGALQAFLFVFGGSVTGPLYDTGHLQTLVRFGSFMIVFGMMMTSLCSEYWQFILAQGLTIGIGSGCLFVPSISLLPQYFVKHRALSIGLAIIGGNFGGVIYTVIFHELQPRIGFAWTTRTIGFIMLAMLLLPISCLRMRMRANAVRRLFELKAWAEPPFSIFAFGCFIGLVGLYIPYFYIDSYAMRNSNFDPNLAFYLVAIMNAGSIAGRAVSVANGFYEWLTADLEQILSYFADKVGPVPIMVLCTSACAIISFGWIGCESQGAIIAFAVLYGFFSGTIISLVPAVTSMVLCPDLRHLGLRLGMAVLPCSFGFLIGSPIGGALVAREWLALQMFTGLTLACSTACMVGLALATGGNVAR